MEVIDPIPISLDPAITAARLRFDPSRVGMPDFEVLISLAGRLLKPRAVYKESLIGAKGEGTIEVAGSIFRSPLLRANLERANKVFPYIITVGPGLECEASAQDDLLRQYYLEEFANIALEQAVAWLTRHIAGRHDVPLPSSLSPGSLADWPITEQRKLFALFGDTEGIIGVRLTDSLLMMPRKSVSGIFFPSEEGFVACQLCDRENCPGRKALHNAPV